jgi:hypothetical protein
LNKSNTADKFNVIVLVAGDSNSFGSETTGDFVNENPMCVNLAYGFYLSRKLNAVYENIALPGSSNIDIISKVISWVEGNKDKISDTLVIIGWTEPGRLLLKDTQRIGIATMNAYRDGDELPREIESTLDVLKVMDPTKEFFRVYTECVLPYREIEMSDTFARLFLGYYLTKHNIKYFTFPTFPMSSSTSAFSSNLFNKKNNLLHGENVYFENIVQPFEWFSMFSKYGLAKGGHLRTMAHRLFANWLVGELQTREII